MSAATHVARATTCLVLAGPTASGKTEASLALAQRWPIEIISMDSALVYRGMDIGTAKPNQAERHSAPHHLLDVRDPTQAYSAAEFARDAHRLIKDITQRGHQPVLVGGTLLYFKALFEGLDELPPAQPALRAQIEAQAKHSGWPALHAQLAKVDPVTAARLAPRDAQRIARALEVWHHTARPLSSFFGQRADATTDLQPRVISLEPDDRSWLHQRIAQRFEQMLEHGLVDEVRRLRARGDLSLDSPSVRCVGYRQTWEMLDQVELEQRNVQTADLERLREKGVAATRQLAKRQLTWLRSMPERQRVACDHPDRLNQVLQMAQALWGPAA
jgi:tRNA dimethylallyltransferase